MEKNVEKEIDEQRQQKVVKSNEIVQRARYDLSLPELKMFAYVVSKIKPTDRNNLWYQFTVKEFCGVIGIDGQSGGNYKRVKDIAKGLRDKSFWLLKSNGKKATVGWFDKVIDQPGNGTIKIRLDEDMHAYVTGLYENFTQYELIYALPMKSVYSFRIYEILKSYAYQGTHTFDIDELKQMFMVENKYKNFKDFRKYVLETATQEINEHTDIEVKWEPVNCGRKVTQVIFYIKERDTWDRVEAQFIAEEKLSGQMHIFDFK